MTEQVKLPPSFISNLCNEINLQNYLRSARVEAINRREQLRQLEEAEQTIAVLRAKLQLAKLDLEKQDKMSDFLRVSKNKAIYNLEQENLLLTNKLTTILRLSLAIATLSIIILSL